MKNVFLGLFMLAATTMFANTSVETSELKKEIKGKTQKEEFFSCSSKTVTTTKENLDGTSVSTTTTTVQCDTARELAEYHAAVKELGIKR